MKIYVWNSSATSVTGPKIGEKLAEIYGDNNVVVTRNKPDARRGDIVLCYGTKTSERTTFANGVKVFNHPDNIRKNRDKYKALEILADAHGVTVPDFGPIGDLSDVDIKRIIAKTGIAVARSKYHQMGRGLYLCTTIKSVKKAAELGAYYVQSYKPAINEYRVNVNFGEIAVVSRKELVEDAHAAWKASYKEKLTKLYPDADEDQLDRFLNVIAKDLVLPDFMVRSHKRGWTFKRVNIDRSSDRMKEMATKAVEALGLDFGAVDIGIDTDRNPFVIEVNTGAALEGRSLTKFIEAFTAQFDNNREAQAVAEVAQDVVEDIRADRANNNNDVRDLIAQLMNQQARINEAIQELNGRLQ